MAIVTKPMGGFTGITFQVDYDDVNLRLTAIRCINTTAHACRGQVTATANGRTYNRTFAANQTTELAIPTNAPARLSITVDARGRIDGVDYSLSEFV
jgi:hypothetical protein